MTAKRDLIMDIFLNIIWLAMFYGIFLAPAVTFFDMWADLLLGVMTGIFAYFLFLRRVVGPVALMVLGHIIVPIAAWILSPGLFYILVYFVMAVVLTVFSLYQRYRRAMSVTGELVSFAPLVLIVLGLIAAYNGAANVVIPYATMIIITAAGGRLHQRMAQVDMSLAAISQNSTQPVKKILDFDYKAMIVLGALLVALILVLNTVVFRPLLSFIAGNIPNLNFEFTISDEDYMTYFGGGSDGGGPGAMYMLMAEQDANRSFFIWRILDVILFIVLPVLIGVFAFSALAALVHNIYMRWKKRGLEVPDMADGEADIKEFLQGPRLRNLWRRGPSNENKLRRRFRETVARHIKKGAPIKKSDTPIEMAVKIVSEDIGELADAYAGVRYK